MLLIFRGTSENPFTDPLTFILSSNDVKWTTKNHTPYSVIYLDFSKALGMAVAEQGEVASN